MAYNNDVPVRCNPNLTQLVCHWTYTIGVVLTLPGLGYYFFSNALYDHNTAHKTGAQSMQDSNMVFYVVQHFIIALQI